jgi:DNA-binding protein H-NS
MTALEKVQAQIAKLQAQAEAIVARQSSGVIEKIRDLMTKHGLTIADIEAHLKGAKRGLKISAPRVGNGSPLTAAEKGKLPPKYLNPKTGETWSGHARPPAWIKNVKDRAKFLIARGVASTAPSAAKPKRAGAYVRGPQPAMYRDPKSGATWSGRGRAPSWIAEAKNRNKFLISGAAEATVATKAGSASKAKTVGKKASTAVGVTAGKGQPKGQQAAKYVDPKSGATWSGRGPAPAWLAGAKDRTKFLIDGAGAAADVSASAETKPSAKRAVTKKAAVKKVAATKTAPTKKVAVKKVVAKKAVSAEVPTKKSPAKKAPRRGVAVPAAVAAVESGAELTT